MYNALQISGFIVYYCIRNSLRLSNLRLQKILYFVQAEFLISEKHACFYNEIEAWDFGPVVPEVYNKYKIFGSSNIEVAYSNDIESSIDFHDRTVIINVIEACKQYSTYQLVSITHSQSPWLDNYSKGSYNTISQQCIREYFGNAS